MFCEIHARDGDGVRILVGHVVTWGPATVLLYITDPPSRAGALAEIQIETIVEVRRLAS